MPRNILGPRAIPGAILIHYQANGVTGIVLPHGRPLIRDDLLHEVTFPEEFVPVANVEIDCASLRFHPVVRLAVTEIPGVMMQRPADKLGIVMRMSRSHLALKK